MRRIPTGQKNIPLYHLKWRFRQNAFLGSLYDRRPQVLLPHFHLLLVGLTSEHIGQSLTVAKFPYGCRDCLPVPRGCQSFLGRTGAP